MCLAINKIMIPNMYPLPFAFHPSQRLVSAHSNLLMGRICWGLRILPRRGFLNLATVTIPLEFMGSHIWSSLLKDQLLVRHREKAWLHFHLPVQNWERRLLCSSLEIRNCRKTTSSSVTEWKPRRWLFIPNSCQKKSLQIQSQLCHDSTYVPSLAALKI